jgi:hypothetical protein
MTRHLVAWLEQGYFELDSFRFSRTKTDFKDDSGKALIGDMKTGKGADKIGRAEQKTS